MIHPKTRKLIIPARDRKIILLVIDGVGGLPRPETGCSELEEASIPNLDRLASLSSGGRMVPIDHGVTPGSGPAHLALFGYPPYEIEFGRGALEALGSDFDLRAGDLAARANYATIDEDGIVLDRRADKPSDAENRRLCAKLTEALGGRIDDVEVHILPGKEHRFTVVFRGEGLGSALNDIDPQREGRRLLDLRPADAASERSARIVARFLQKAREALRDEEKATGMLLRGFSDRPDVMPFNERFGVDSGAIAAYPMYRGVAKLVGMEVLGAPVDFAAEVELLESRWADHDFFFLHYKGTDSAGHSGDFEAKKRQLQAVDSFVPRLEALGPAALVVTGDHSTPCIYKEHSWHPVPTLIHSPLALSAPGATYSERGLLGGDLGVFPATQLLPLALAHASRLLKFGA